MAANRALDGESVEPIVRKTAAWAWRLLVIALAVAVGLWGLWQLEVIFMPVALATMVTALLLPAVDWLDDHRVNRGGAVAIVLLGGAAIFGGILTFVVSQFISGLPDLVEQVTQSIDNLRKWLVEGPLHLSPDQINNAGQTAIKTLRDNQEAHQRALSTAATLTEIVTGALLMLFTLIFLLHGGRDIYSFVTKLVPAHSGIGHRRQARRLPLTHRLCAGDVLGGPRRRGRDRYRTGDHEHSAGAAFGVAGVPRGLHTIGGSGAHRFARGCGGVAGQGWIYALITLAVVIGVMQLEAHVLQPLVMGRAVSIHPLAVVLAISTGAVLAGIGGALLSVPMVAFLNSALRVLVAPDPVVEESELEESEGVVVRE